MPYGGIHFLNKFDINLELNADFTYYVYSLCIMEIVRKETEDVVQSKSIISWSVQL